VRRFGLLRFIARLHALLGILIIVGGVVGAALSFASSSSPVVVGDQLVTFGGPAAAAGILIGALVLGLSYIAIGHLLLAFLSIEEHVRRSAIAQEKLLRANQQLIQQLDQRLP
jgi:hypothetical protein